MVVCLGIGIPFLIIGINKTKCANADIRRFKTEFGMNNNANLTSGLSDVPQSSPESAPQNGQPYQNQYYTNVTTREKNVKVTFVNTLIQEDSSADEIRKFKELLDLGNISQEEFDIKKKQLS